MKKTELFKLFFVWNKSKIRDFKFCPYYFKLRYLDKVKIVDENILKGVNVHDIIATYYKEKKEINYFSLINIGSIKDYLNTFVEFEIKRKKEGFNVILVEKTFNVNVYLEQLVINDEAYNYLNKIGNNLIINGKIDLLLRKDDKYYIVDFKTGKSEEDFFYVWLLFKALNIEANLITINLLNSERKEIEFSKKSVEMYEKELFKRISLIVEEIYNSIQTNKWKKDKRKCNSCIFKEYCNE